MNMSVNELAAEIKRQQGLKKDFLATSWTGFQMSHDGIDLELEGLSTLRLRDYAHADLSGFTEIPKPYYDRMRRDQPGLLATNVNRWLQEKQEPRLIRTLAGETRAVLSNKFRPLDNSDLIEAALPALYEHPNIEIKKCELTERKLYMTAVLPKLDFEVRVGDRVQFGLSISNSEIGQGALEVALYALRLVCLNGMTMPDNKQRKNHIGGRLGDQDMAAEYFADDTRKLADQAFFLKLRDTTRHMLTEGAVEQSVEQMRRSAGIKLDARPDKAVKEVTKRFGLSEVEGQGVLAFLLQGGDMTMWGMANALTAAGRENDDADRADELERMGGKLITLAPGEWAQVANAA